MSECDVLVWCNNDGQPVYVKPGMVRKLGYVGDTEDGQADSSLS